jgi:hypothetical protein
MVDASDTDSGSVKIRGWVEILTNAKITGGSRITGWVLFMMRSQQAAAMA